MSNFGGVPNLAGNNASGFGGGNNFGGANLPNQNQFGNNGLGNGMGYGGNNNPLNSLAGNNGTGSLAQLGGGQLGGNNSYGGLGQGNNSYGNNLGGGNNSNGPIYGMNNNGGSNNGPNDEGKETTQVTIPKDVRISISMNTRFFCTYENALLHLSICLVGWRHHRQRRWTHSTHPNGFKCFYHHR